MAADPTVFIAGEDVGAHGGVFHTFDGVQAEFGERRAVDTPISEQAIIGLGIGAAVTGLRPIVDLMFMDFTLVAADQIVNQAAKFKYMFGGDAKLPLTITTTGGAGLSAAAQHSQSLEALFCHIPGIKVVYPSNAYDVKGLMAASVREDNPVLFVLHKRMLGQKGVVPEERYELPLGVANVAREGDDVTVVSWGKTANDCRAAADVLAADGISCELIDLRTLSPLDIDTVVRSVTQDQPGRRRPRGGAVRRLRGRGRGADPGVRVRLSRRARRPRRRAVLAGPVHARAREPLRARRRRASRPASARPWRGRC